MKLPLRITVLMLVTLWASAARGGTAYTNSISALTGIKRGFVLGETSAANGVPGGITDFVSGKGGTTVNMANGAFGQTGPILDDATTAIQFTSASNTVITLDNSDGAMTLPTAGTAFYIIAWVKPTGSNAHIVFFNARDAGGKGIQFFLSREATYGTYYPRLDVIAADGTEILMDGNMSHLQATGYACPLSDYSCLIAQYSPPASGSVPQSAFQIWLNGIRLTMSVSFTSGTLTGMAAMPATPLPAIGAQNQAGTSFPFSGTIGQVAFGVGNVITDKLARDIYIAGIGNLKRRSFQTVILSTDCESDVDSYVGEFGVAFGLKNNRLIGLPNVDITNALSGGFGTNDAKAVSMLATYEGNTPIVSQNKGLVPQVANVFTPTVVAGGFPFSVDSSNVGESVATLKAALNAAPNNSLVFVTMGQLSNLSALINDSAATKALVYQKVQKLVCFAGGYNNQTTYADSSNLVGTGTTAEYNFSTDASSADNVTKNWPTPIEYLDFNLGTGSALPGTAVFSSAGDPKNAAFTGAGETTGRNDWGGVGWLHVVYNESGAAGGSGKLFATSATGTNIVNTATNTPNTGPAGYNKFTFGNTRNVSVSGVGTVTLSDTYITKVRQGVYSAWALRWMLDPVPPLSGNNHIGLDLGIGISSAANSDVWGKVGFDPFKRTTIPGGLKTTRAVTN